MQSKKDIIYNYVQKMAFNVDYKNGVDTEHIANVLKMQRTNVSAALNRLVAEGMLVKSSSRPVKYKLVSDESENIFSEIVGSTGSFRNIIQMAKAAVLYPGGSLNINIVANSGCGTSFLVRKIITFAQQKGVLKTDSPIVTINCRNYAKDQQTLNKKIFGEKEDFSKSSFSLARNGVLFLNHYECLNSTQQSKIKDFLDQESKKSSLLGRIFLIVSSSPDVKEDIEGAFPITIELPTLEERPIGERKKIVDKYFFNEAQNAKKDIIVSNNAIKSMIVSEYDRNVKDLKKEIVVASAKAWNEVNI